jgi:hypothetical protein
VAEGNPGAAADLTPPTDVQGAEVRKSDLMANAEWRNRYLSGGADERTEMSSLNAIIANQAAQETALEGHLSVDFARDRGVSEQVIKHHLIDRSPITPEEHAAALRWRQSHFQDPTWRDLYMKGDMTARREATLSSILISSPVKPAA